MKSKKKKNLSYVKQWNVHRKILNIIAKRICNLLAIVLRYCTHHVRHKNNRSDLRYTHTMVNKPDSMKKKRMMNWYSSKVKHIRYIELLQSNIHFLSQSAFPLELLRFDWYNHEHNLFHLQRKNFCFIRWKKRESIHHQANVRLFSRIYFHHDTQECWKK